MHGHIKRRDKNSWRIAISLGKGPDGKHQYHYEKYMITASVIIVRVEGHKPGPYHSKNQRRPDNLRGHIEDCLAIAADVESLKGGVTLPHESRVESIKESLRERYHRKVIDVSLNDEMNEVAFVTIDMLLEPMTEMLKEYDSHVRDVSPAPDAIVRH
jgi:hypothetical protein